MGTLTGHAAEDSVEIETETLAQTDGVQLELGYYYPNLSTQIRVDTDIGLGTEIDFEDDLDLSDRKGLWSFELNAPLGKRWLVQAEYLDLSRSSSATLERDLTWGEENYQIGAAVRSYFDVKIYRVSAGYRFYNRENWVFGGLIGAHVADTSAGIGLRLTNNTGGSVGWESEVDTGGVVPLPNLGLFWSWRFAEKWVLDTRADFLAVEISGIRGRLLAGALNASYVINPEWSVGLGYSVFDLNIDVDKEDWRGEFSFGYDGPRFYAQFQF